MKPVSLVVSLLLPGLFIPGLARAQEAKPGQQVPTSTNVMVQTGDKEETVEIRYLLFLPQAYGSPEKDEKWPLMLFLHGGGERGDNNLELVKKHGPPRIVEEKKDFPFITISPQCPPGKQWNPQEMAKLTDHVANTYAVDARRIYVTGLSLGSAGTWSLLVAYPGKFAAAIPICGGGDPATAEKMKATPIWVFHGAKDTGAPIAKSEAMVDALKKAGGSVKFTVYPEAGHDAWTETYSNPEVYKWLLEQKLK